MKTDQFIELDRCFVDVSDLRDNEDAAYRSYMSELLGKKRLNWNEILKSRIIVILGEAGSGKTWEFKNQAKLLRQQGKHAFFIPLEHLVRVKLPDVLIPEDEILFRKWNNSNDQVTFFLDSVDESKIVKQTDFEWALDNFIRGIDISKILNVRLIVSSRISEWRIHTDRDMLFQRMRVHSSKENDVSTPPEFRVVLLESLDKARVLKFSKEIGLRQPESFIDAIDYHHAWEFARRPIDVVDLISFWSQNNKLGTLTELIEFDLKNKLKETPERSQSDILTSEQALTGAECLAAAVLFCQRFTFLVLDSIPPNDINGVMNSNECLPNDWTTAMCQALLNRPIFDSASYGRIRFHHRRITEYLTAKWLEKRIVDGCPYPELEDLLFAKRGEQYYVRPSLKPVIAWLSLGNEFWNERIRKRILTCAPNLFLAYGDPELLPPEYKLSVFKNLITYFKGRNRLYIDFNAEALSRLSDPILIPFVLDKVRDPNTPHDILIILIELIRYGKMLDCVEALLEICSLTDESFDLKYHATNAILEIGTIEKKLVLLKIYQQIEVIDFGICSILCEALFPNIINPDGLTDLLRKAKRIQNRSSSLKWTLERHLEEIKLTSEQNTCLLKEILNLVQEKPHVTVDEEELPIASQFYWLGQIIAIVLINLLKRPTLTNGEIELAAQAFCVLGYFQHFEELNREIVNKLNILLEQHFAVRRAYVWLIIKELQNLKSNKEPTLYLVFNHFHYDIVNQNKDDIFWLIKDIREGSTQIIRSTALNLAGDYWYSNRYKYKCSIKKQIKHVIKNNRELKRQYKKIFSNNISKKIRSIFYHRKYLKYKYKNIWNDYYRYLLKLKRLMWLWCNLRKLQNGTLISVLASLASEAGQKNSKWGVQSWTALESKYGSIIARAVIAGCKASWRKYEPLLPYVKTNSYEIQKRIIIGLSGINMSVAEGDLNFEKLASNEVKIAFRYAINEINGFPDWLSKLIPYHFNILKEQLTECIKIEWQFPAEQQNVYKVLNSLRYDKTELVLLIGDVIIDELKTCDPQNYDIFESAISILFSLPEIPVTALSNLAARRSRIEFSNDYKSILWMVVWFQLDAIPAVQKLEELLLKITDPANLMIQICGRLSSRFHRDIPVIKNPSYINTKCLKKLIPLVYSYIRVEDDIDHSNEDTYSPTIRDDAQDFRNGLFERLAQAPESEAVDVLRIFASEPMFLRYRDWILNLIDQRIELASEANPWEPSDIVTFMHEHEISPRSDNDLFKITCKRFSEIKDGVERSDISSRYDLHPDAQESLLRSWLARQLRMHSRGRYNVPQEEEIDLKERPDLRIESPGTRPISIEIKWADNWTLEELKDGLIIQLVGQYLRASDSNYGIYVLGYKGEKDYWKDKENKCNLPFHELVKYIENKAEEVLQQRNDINGLRVYGINFKRVS